MGQIKCWLHAPQKRYIGLCSGKNAAASKNVVAGSSIQAAIDERKVAASKRKLAASKKSQTGDSSIQVANLSGDDDDDEAEVEVAFTSWWQV